MIEIMPYIGGLVTLLFSAAFYWGILELQEYGDQRENQD